MTTNHRPAAPVGGGRRGRTARADGRRRRLVLVDGPGDVLVVGSRLQAGTAVVTLSGVIDARAVGSCRAAVDRILQARPADVAVDLAAGRSRGAAWTVLQAVHRYLQRHGVRTCLVAVPPPIAAELAEHGLAQGFGFAPTLQDALEASARRAHLGDRRPTPGPSTGVQVDHRTDRPIWRASGPVRAI